MFKLHLLRNGTLAVMLYTGPVVSKSVRARTASPSSSSLSSFSHGCRKHCSAVALFIGSNSSIGMRNSASSKALRSSHWYFSISTSIRPHGFSFVMWRNSPADKHSRRLLHSKSHHGITHLHNLNQTFRYCSSCTYTLHTITVLLLCFF